MRKAKGAEYAPRDQHRKRPGQHKKSLNKSEKRQQKQGRYKGGGR
jgi:hypothetical protein|tara:strand:- start:320 stop:454 length:135 start_codon:yes stop_codon:yes gene_type:complete